MNNIRFTLNNLKNRVVNLLPIKRKSSWEPLHIFTEKNKKKTLIIVGAIFFVIVMFLLIYKGKNSSYDSSYYEMRADYYVEPFDVIKGLEKAILVDVRPRDRYDEEHIIDAQFVEVKIDPKSNAIQNKNDVEKRLKELASHGDKLIIYGENSYSHVPYAVAFVGVRAGVKVKLLEVGWNEFRHFSAFWVPEKVASKINILDYIEGQDRK